jgi:hypothetical protein
MTTIVARVLESMQLASNKTEITPGRGAVAISLKLFRNSDIDSVDWVDASLRYHVVAEWAEAPASDEAAVLVSVVV